MRETFKENREVFEENAVSSSESISDFDITICDADVTNCGKVVQDEQLEGRRIVDMKYFFPSFQISRTLTQTARLLI